MKKKAAELLQRYQDGTATPEEKAWVESWYLYYKPKGRNLSQQELKAEYKLGYKRLQKSIQETPIRLWPRLVAAASILVILSAGLYLWKADQINGRSNEVILHTADIAPGSNRATLRLADGRRIPLSENQSGIVINEESIRYADGTQLPDKIAAATYAVLETPQGGQYQITLPDGTKVWLNAASTLTYPTHFDSKERTVELSGEAYFEVASQVTSDNPMKKSPFVVKTARQNIEVLGTHFNVQAYTNEPATHTTLQEGSVRIWIPNTNQESYLKPNQQANIGPDETIQIKKVDASDAIAWKDGFFVFDKDRLEDVMRPIARWYNIDIRYEDENLKDERFSGSIYKYTHVSHVLQKLALTGGVHFELTNRQLIIK